MYVYTGTKMRGFPYRKVMTPSIGNRFQMGTDASPVSNATTNLSVNLVRVAMLIAVGAIGWKLYDAYKERRLVANLPVWPGIGPAFNVGSQIGPAFSLGPWIL